MNKRMCDVSVANVMIEPNHRSELHTQMLFGDLAFVLGEKSGNWVKIKLDWDNYEGWILESQLNTINLAEEVEKPTQICNIGINQLSYNSQIIQLYPGTFLPIHLSSQLIRGELIQLSQIKSDQNFIQTILSSFLQVPYVWGGISPAGIDCSGLSQLLYRFLGIQLPHFASEQMEFGEILDFIQMAECGDLAFFENSEGEIKHVGVMLNSHEIIHASESNGRVMIDSIDQEGIINKITSKRTHHLRVIKRLL
jgi:hypothetical protein